MCWEKPTRHAGERRGQSGAASESSGLIAGGMWILDSARESGRGSVTCCKLYSPWQTKRLEKCVDDSVVASGLYQRLFRAFSQRPISCEVDCWFNGMTTGTTPYHTVPALPGEGNHDHDSDDAVYGTGICTPLRRITGRREVELRKEKGTDRDSRWRCCGPGLVDSQRVNVNVHSWKGPSKR